MKRMAARNPVVAVTTNAGKEIVECILGRREWGKPLTRAVEDDVAGIVRKPHLTPLTDEEEDLLRRPLEIHLNHSSRDLRDFTKWVTETRGSQAALQAMTDVRLFEKLRVDWNRTPRVTPLGGAQSSRYWMEELVLEKTLRLYDGKTPVSLCDHEGARGLRAHEIKRKLHDAGVETIVHVTDMDYEAHYRVDKVHLLPLEMFPKDVFGDGVNISTAEFSIRHATLPHIALRNILNMTGDAAYLTIEDLAGVGTAIKTVRAKDYEKQMFEYLTQTTFTGKTNADALKTACWERIHDELSNALERGFSVRVSQGIDDELLPVRQVSRGKEIRKIIAVRQNTRLRN